MGSARIRIFLDIRFIIIHLFSVDGCRAHVTPNAYVYQYPWPRIAEGTSMVDFKLRANNDGHIALSSEPVDKDDVIEIGKGVRKMGEFPQFAILGFMSKV